MKLNFSEPSRRTKKKIKLYLLLFALLAGLLGAAESRYAIFRIYDIETDPRGTIPQSVIWGTISAREEKCWPLFLMSGAGYCRFIEEYYPVELKMRLSGWGKFRIKVLPLNPVIKMYWAGKFWYVTEDGKTWRTSLGENVHIQAAGALGRPILSWSSDRATPLDIEGSHGNIYPSSLPMPHIMKWYENIRALGWSEKVKYIQAGIREGKPVVRLIFYNPSGGNGTNIMFVDDPAFWQEAGLAVKKIYPDILNVPAGLFIDTTYKGKILVKNKVQ